MQDQSLAKAEEAKQTFGAQIKAFFPHLVVVHDVHAGPNRAQRRQAKYAKKQKEQ